MSHDYFNELTNGSVVDVNNNPLTGSARGCLQFVLNAVATRFLTPPPRLPRFAGEGDSNCKHALEIDI